MRTSISVAGPLLGFCLVAAAAGPGFAAQNSSTSGMMTGANPEAWQTMNCAKYTSLEPKEQLAVVTAINKSGSAKGITTAKLGRACKNSNRSELKDVVKLLKG